MTPEQRVIDDLAVALINACDRWRKEAQRRDDMSSMMLVIQVNDLSNNIEEWLIKKRAEWEARS